MAEFTVEQKVKCCYWLAEFKFPIAVQRRFRQEYGANAQEKPAPAARVEDVRQAFQRSPRKSIRWASLELSISKAYML